MLYYLLFWTLLGFIIHFYIIFGTNLLTGGPTQNCCFLPVLGFRRKGISNGVQTEWNLQERDFLNEQDPGDLDPTSRNKRGGGHEVGGRAYPPGTPSTLVGPLLLHRRNPSTTKKYTSVMIRVCQSRSLFLSCMYIHDEFMTESR